MLRAAASDARGAGEHDPRDLETHAARRAQELPFAGGYWLEIGTALCELFDSESEDESDSEGHARTEPAAAGAAAGAAAAAGGAAAGSGGTLARCGACKGTRVIVTLAQTRGGDEAMTAFYVCEDCGKRWKS